MIEASSIVHYSSYQESWVLLQEAWNLEEHTCPMHWPTQGQWWSNLSTQLSHTEQCEQRGGRYNLQVSQYFTFTTIRPSITTSFVRGTCGIGVWVPPPVSIEAEESYVTSSSGGCKLRGTMPGSRAEVRKSSTNT